MGQISDDIMEGFQCGNCGVCFCEPHGFPVLCESCWEAAEKEQRVKKTKFNAVFADGCFQKELLDEI